MKKALLIIMCIIVLTGCSKKSRDGVVKKFNKDVSGAKNYELEGKMQIIGDEEEYNYVLNVKYMDDKYYSVNLLNTNNNHKQVILKNNDGVYVVTPELNKSFKFQSSWPDNSSQSYLLSSILKDINGDDKNKLINKDNSYIIKARVNYPNNSELAYEMIYFDDNMNLKKVVVFDNEDKERIVTEFTKIDLKANNILDDFKLDSYINTDKNLSDDKKCDDEKCEKEAANIVDDIIYPLYLPNNTYLTSSERIDSEGGRVILTFGGDKNFTVVEEAASIPSVFEINPVYGDPVLLNDVLGVMGDNSVRWEKGNISYYLTSNNLSNSEMVLIATSMNQAMSVLGSK